MAVKIANIREDKVISKEIKTINYLYQFFWISYQACPPLTKIFPRHSFIYIYILLYISVLYIFTQFLLRSFNNSRPTSMCLFFFLFPTIFQELYKRNVCFICSRLYFIRHWSLGLLLLTYTLEHLTDDPQILQVNLFAY